ncbi:MAG: DDE-type integrase/transposase/recombinase [bacterium]|nr:DDE-type integrase/transposase/recombinase [bacterium]
MGDTWHLDELFVNIQGRRQYLWRAVDQDGGVIDILVQSRRNRLAAKRHAFGGPRHEPVREQPSRGLASADATARTTDAQV